MSEKVVGNDLIGQRRGSGPLGEDITQLVLEHPARCFFEVWVNLEHPEGRRGRWGDRTRAVIEVYANGLVVQILVEQGGRGIGRSGEKLVISGQSACLILIKKNIQNAGPICEIGQRFTVTLLIQSQLQNPRGRGPHLNQGFTLVGFILEVGEVPLHRLQSIKAQHVGAIVHGGMDKKRSHLVGEVGMDAVMGLRGLGFRREVIQVGLKGWRREVQIPRQKQRDHGEETNDEWGTALKDRSRFGKAFLKVRLFHGIALSMEHKNKQVRCGSSCRLHAREKAPPKEKVQNKKEGRKVGYHGCYGPFEREKRVATSHHWRKPHCPPSATGALEQPQERGLRQLLPWTPRARRP